jgi:hypothetical protein
VDRLGRGIRGPRPLRARTRLPLECPGDSRSGLLAIKLIEATLERRVVGFMSANHFDPDLAAEVFVLDRREDENQLEEGEAQN